MAEKTKGTLVSWRPDIKVLDCTLRDGGLVNNFRFTSINFCSVNGFQFQIDS